MSYIQYGSLAEREINREFVIDDDRHYSEMAWQVDAACAPRRTPEAAADEFFPAGQMPTAVRLACTACPVREQCLQYALDHDERGIWGGTSDRQRAAMRRGAA